MMLHPGVSRQVPTVAAEPDAHSGGEAVEAKEAGQGEAARDAGAAEGGPGGRVVEEPGEA